MRAIMGWFVILASSASAAGAQETEQWGAGAVLPNQPGDYRYSIVVTASGLTYIGGSKEVSPGDFDFLVARFTAAGALDTTFGSGGTVTIDTAGGTEDELANDLKIDDAGLIYISGGRSDGMTLVARLDATGALDPTFGAGGVAIFTVAGGLIDEGMAVEPGPTPRIYVVGSDGMNLDAVLVRLTNAGVVDATFNGTGFLTWDNGGNFDYFGGATVDASLFVYVNGATRSGPGAGDMPGDGSDAIVRKYDSTGTVVAAFGTGGTFTYAGPLGDGTERCVIRGSHLYVAGSTNLGSPGTPNHAGLVLKIDATTGVGDATFGTAGAAVYDRTAGIERLFAVDADAAGKVYASGVTPNDGNPADEDLLILKYNSNGTLDTNFDGDGAYIADSGGLDGGEGIRAGGSFHVVAKWGNSVRGMYFKEPGSEAVPDDDDDSNCGLLGCEGILLIALLLLRRRS